jgi:hypothetical protein
LPGGCAGKQTRTCSANGASWSDWGACSGDACQICVPGAVEQRFCSLTADCAGTQTRTCSADGLSWSGYSECTGTPCTRQVTVNAQKQDYYTFTHWEEIEVEGEEGVVKVVIPYVLTYRWSGLTSATATINTPTPPRVGSVVLTVVDQSVSSSRLHTPDGDDPCDVGIAVTTDVTDEAGRTVTVYATNTPENYLYTPGDLFWGGKSTVQIVGKTLSLKSTAVATPRGTGCSGIPHTMSWTLSLP